MTHAVQAPDVRHQVVAEALSWLGTPYHHLGDLKGPGGGVDCAMLLVRLYQGLGLIEAFDPRPYSHQWHLHRGQELYLGWLERCAVEVEAAQALPGDVCVFRFGRTFSHGAVLVDGNARTGTVVHALARAGVVLAQPLSDPPLADREVRWFSIIQQKGQA